MQEAIESATKVINHNIQYHQIEILGFKLDLNVVVQVFAFTIGMFIGLLQTYAFVH